MSRADGETQRPGVHHERGSLLASSAVMAAGTVFSRLSGFLRSILLVAALGSGLHADLFNIANTVPNMLYILLAGGVFNAVLVPQLVRAMKSDPDGGEAYTNRIVTLAGGFLLLVTVVLVVAAPLLMRLFLSPEYDDPSMAGQRDSVIAFARVCLPQVFFYGMFVLVGQILNARGRFGPMMWAPIANNVIAIAVLAAYLIVFGTATPAEQFCGFSSGQIALLGVGSTAGIAAQLVILVPYLRAAGYRFSPRFDFRGTGLGHTLRLGVWTVAFVIVNQIAYTIVVRLASAGTAGPAFGRCGDPSQPAVADMGTGYTIYSSSFLLMMVPHSIITVSLATAVLPRLSSSASEHRPTELAARLADTLRTALVLIVPLMAVLPVVAEPASQAVFGYGAGADTFRNFAPTLAVFAPGLICFTVHYLLLRGFYATERNRTVFFVQCAVAATNIVMAVVLVGATDAHDTAPALAAAYGTAYLVGAIASYLLLRRHLGGLETARNVRFGVRLVLATALATTLAGVLLVGLEAGVDAAFGGSSPITALLIAGTVVVADLAAFLAFARLFRLTETAELVGLLRRRLPGRLRG